MSDDKLNSSVCPWGCQIHQDMH